MADQVSVEQIAEAMFKMVKEVQGKKKLKPMDLMKAVREKFGAEKDVSKEALRSLIDTGRCVYSYFGGSFVELPPEKGVQK